MLTPVKHYIAHWVLVFSTLWRRFRTSQNTKVLTMAALVGLVTGLATWVFRFAIDVVSALNGIISANVLGFLGPFALVIVLGTAGLIVGWLTSRYVGTERHRGITGIIECVAVGGSRLPALRMPAKALASVFSIGAGASVGTEDPSVQIGSNLGSYFGTRFQLTEDQRRLMVSAGAASATSAAFNAPIAGVFFALEVIMNAELSTGSVGVIVLSAVIAAAVTQSFGLSEVTIQQPLAFTLDNPGEILFFIPLGIILPVFAALLIRALFWQRDLWNQRAANVPYPLRTGVAGMLMGLAGVFFPALLGSGQETMNAVLHGDVRLSVMMLLMLALGKILLTTMSIAGGFVGGVFTPSLFIGTLIGSLYGQIIVQIVPNISDPRVFAIAGMAGMMVGVVRAPITAIMLVFELTNDYRMILPIMLVAVLTMYLTQAVEPHGVYKRGLAEAGLLLAEGRNVDVMQGILVRDIMREPPTISPGATLKELRDLLHEQHRREMIVVDDARHVLGMVTLGDLQDAYDLEDHGQGLCVRDICKQDIVKATADESLWVAVRRMGMHSVGRLPVVDPTTGQVMGILNRHDIVRAYNTTIAEHIRDQHHSERIRLQNLTGAHVFELTVKKNAPVANHAIQDIKWPSECTIASIQRNNKLLIPHGDTILKPRDMVTLVAEPSAERRIADLFGMM